MATNNVRFKASLDDQVSGKLDKIRDKFDRLGASKGAQAMLMGVGMSAGTAAWNLLGTAVDKTVQFLGDSVKAASDQREAMALTAQVFGRNTEAIKEWSRNAKDAFSSTEAMQFASTFGTAFKSVGMDIDEVAAKSKDMVKLAGDLGSAFNTSSEEAATALRSGLIGESEPMRRFGVFLNEAAVQAKALEMGIAKAGQKLTDTQKVAARYAIIMEQTADSQGMFGRDAESLADKSKMLESRIADLQAEIGGPLVTSLVAATEVTLGLGDALEQMSEGGREGDDAFVDFAQSALELTGAAGMTDEAFAKLRESIAKEREEQDKATASWDTGSEALAGFREPANRSSDAVEDFGDTVKATTRKIKLSFGSVSEYLLNEYTADFDRAMGIQEARADLHNAKTSADKAQAYADLAELGALSQKDYAAWIATLEKLAASTKGKVHQAYVDALADIRKLRSAAGKPITIDVTYRSHNGRTTNYNEDPNAPGQAMGGYVQPGRSYTVGEAGMETLVMGANGGGYVIPNARGGNGGGSGNMVPVSIPIVIDGREIARVVDRHLYYEATRAPRSSYAG